MTDQEARDEREALRSRLEREFGPFLAHWPSDPDRFFGQAADAILADGYRKHPEPEWEYGRVAHPALVVDGIRRGEVYAEALSDTPGNVDYQRRNGWAIVRRTKAGPWEPAP